MRYAFPSTLAVVLILLIFSVATHAAETAYAWLMKMNQAARQLNYDGTFVYQHGVQLEAMRIVHRAAEGAVKERLVSLTGSAREVIRDEQQVMCYLPNRNSVVVEHRLTRDKRFPAILPEHLDSLKKHYNIKLGSQGRVTGRVAQSVIIKPRDKYRYGYHLWSDTETGLLLKADLVDHMGSTLEQFMFAQVRIGGVIKSSDLEPDMSAQDMSWYWGKTMDRDNVKPLKDWSIAKLPTGFVLSNHMMRKNPTRNNLVEHLVYSDGLAAVSVFIEKIDSRMGPAMRGTSRMGAVHAYGNVINEHQLIVVGEVPAATVELIGESVTAKP